MRYHLRHVLLQSFACLVLCLFAGLSGARWLAAQPFAVALDPEKTLTQYLHDVWQYDEGLPQNTVQAILQTADGYLWLGTHEGLVRFDGVEFKVFDKSNTLAFEEGHTIMALLEDRAGALWVGTNGGGLIRFSKGRFTHYGADVGLAGQAISALAEAADGTLWVGTFDAGLFLCWGEECLPFSGQLSSDLVRTVQVDRAGNVWVGTDSGLNRITGETVQVYRTEDGLPADFVMALYEDREGSLWVSTRGGLGRMQEGAFHRVHPAEGWPEEVVWSIWEDGAGSLWLGLDQGGLVRYHKGRFEAFTPEEGLSHGRVLALYEDREGSLWIGTEAGGLNRLRDGAFTTYTTEEGLSGDLVFTVYEDTEGDLWIGTEGGGLNRLRDGAFTTYTTENGLSSNVVSSVYGDPSGALWIGTLGDGLNRLKAGVFTRYTVEDGLPSALIFSLYVDTSGSLWIGTDKGLGRFSEGRFTTYSTEDGLSSNFITAILEDGQGTLWVGTYDAGLNRFSEGQFTSYGVQDGLRSDLVLALYEDKEGTLWIGTYEGGLSRLEDGALTTYTPREGLFDDKIYQILEDEQGNLWMGCNKGIFKVSKAELDAVARGERDTVTPISYGKNDGLKSREVNGGVQPAGWKSRDGRLWFPTVEGLAVIDPASLRRHEAVPPVMIQDVLVDNAPIEQRAEAVLEAGTEKVEFQFVAPSLAAPEAIRYRYQLEGYDDDWSGVTSRRVVTYTHLDPGTYLFRVIAMNKEGVWNETGASFAFTLRPFFYESSLFWLLTVLLVVLLGTVGYRLNIRQLTARHGHLERTVEERTQDLRVAKEKIEVQADELRASLREKEVLLREIHHRVKNNLQIISSLLHLQSQKVDDEETRALFKDCRDRIYAMSMIHERLYQSENLEQVDFSTYLGSVTEQLFHSYNVNAHEVVLSVHIDSTQLRADQAIPCGLIVSELVSNALKHAFPGKDNGHITVSFKADGLFYRLIVADDGVGFSDHFELEKHQALGLQLVKALVQKLKGTLNVANRAGTTFEVTFPAQPAETAFEVTFPAQPAEF